MRAALRLVHALAVRHLFAHRLRLVLSSLGVASGVSLAIAVSSLGSSIRASLEDIAGAAASSATIEIRPLTGEGLGPEVAEDVARIQDVEAVGATVESFTQLRAGTKVARGLLLGIDAGAADLAPTAVDPSRVPAADPLAALDRLAEDPLGLESVFSEGPEALFDDDLVDQEDFQSGGLAFSASLAEALGVGAGDGVEVATSRGWRPARVSFVVDDGARGRRRTAVGPIDEVQELLGRPSQADVIYVSAPDVQATIGEMQRVVGMRGRVGPVAFRDDEVEQLLSGATLLLSLTGVVALFVGAFLVYNTMSMAAVERTTEMAVLRAVGARRRQVFTLQTVEGAILGVIGSLTGVAGGVLLSGTVLTSRGSGLQEIYPIEVTRLVVRPRDLLLAGGVGVLAAVVASWLPARRVARSDPAASLGPPGALEEPVERSHRLAIVAGTVLLVAGSVNNFVFLTRGNIDPVGIGLALQLGGMALLIRPGVPAVTRLLLRPAAEGARSPGIVRLAAGEVLRSPSRTAFTVGAVLLALSIVIGVTLGIGSFTRTFQSGFDEILRADLYVRTATWRPFGSDVPLDASVADEIRQVPGVFAAIPFKFTPSTIDGNAVILVANDNATYSTFPGLSEDYRAVEQRNARLLAEPRNVLVSPSVRIQLGYEVGGQIEMPTPAGPVQLTVAGEFADPSAVTPTLYFSFAEFSRLWGTSGADTFPTAIEPGADPGHVRAAIVQRLGERYGVVVDTRKEYMDRLNGLVGSLLGVVSSLTLLVVVTAGLGLANTLVISTLERRRDFGVLRAIGMRRRQVRRMVVVEAVIVGSIGAGFAAFVGTGLGWLFTIGSQSQIGMPVTFVLAPFAYLQAAVFGIAGAVLAALYPAMRAARLNVVEALQYE